MVLAYFYAAFIRKKTNNLIDELFRPFTGPVPHKYFIYIV